MITFVVAATAEEGSHSDLHQEETGNLITVKTASCYSNGTTKPHRSNRKDQSKIDPVYLPYGANVHLRLILGSMGPHESAPKRHLDRFSHFSRHTLIIK